MTDVEPYPVRGCKDDVKLSRPKTVAEDVAGNATNVSRNLPFLIEGACYVKPDHKDPFTIAVGAIKRMGAPKSVPSERLRNEYLQFCQRYDEKHFEPVSPDEFRDQWDWLENLDISEERRAQIREAMEKNDLEGFHFDDVEFLREFAEVLSFIKDEFYDTEKASRWINARCDRSKAFFGPLCDMAMERLTRSKHVIKTVPVADRARLIYDTMYATDRVYWGTDFTSFEAHFKGWLMEIEGLSMWYLLQNHPLIKLLKAFFDKVLSGKNVAQMRGFGCFVFVALRCSGEMNTSYGNTYHNERTIVFFLERNGCLNYELFVEGDDGLFTAEPLTSVPTAEQFLDLGWEVKIECFDSIGDASFCGNVFDPDDFIVVTDPRKVLLTLGWTSRKYLGAGEAMLSQLLKAKVLSVGYQYGRNPILWSLVRRLLGLLKGVNVRLSIIFGMDAWERDKFRRIVESELIVQPPPIATRLLVERLYGITIDQQIQLEEQFSVIELGPCTPCVPIFTQKQYDSWRYVANQPWQFYEEPDLSDSWVLWIHDVVYGANEQVPVEWRNPSFLTWVKHYDPRLFRRVKCLRKAIIAGQ